MHPAQEQALPTRAGRHAHVDLPRPWICLPDPIQRQALRDPLLRGLFPSHVGYFPKAARHHIERERGLASTIFNYCVGGRGECTIDGRRFDVDPGDLMVVPSGLAHRYATKPDHPWTVHWFHARGESLPHLLVVLGISAASPVVHLGRSPKLEALFTEVREKLEEDYTGIHLLCAAQALAHAIGTMIGLKQARSRRSPSTQQRVLETIEYVKRHLNLPMSVPELALMAKLSSSRYSGVVRELTGHPPKEYFTRLRIHRAAQWLGSTELSVRSVAEAVGFADPLHFSRVFRRIYERSPSAYRAQQSRPPLQRSGSG